MKVFIRVPISRPNDPGYYGYNYLTVTIADTCPLCGGPRGTPTRRPFMEDGAPYSVDCWQNPCGHIDSYVEVAKEALKAGVE